jgi:ornithine decarboxylase
MLTDKIERFLKTRPNTPFLAIDLDLISAKYQQLCCAFPRAAIHYAVKANPARRVVARLAALGSSFDVASTRELDLCLSSGVPAERISYGNTVKKAADIDYAFRRGVRIYAFDSEAELEKIAQRAPGAGVMCRLLTSSGSAEWPLSKKFGCGLEMASDLLFASLERGLRPLGLTFHVGSQQTDPQQWDGPIAEASTLYLEMARRGIELPMIDIGGGLPAQYRGSIPSTACYAEAIGHALQRAFGDAPPLVMLEPGRSLVADAGVIESEVVLVAKKARTDSTRWVYLDVGKFGGLAETLGESIQYRMRTSRRGRRGPVVIAGPTCDSADILYERTVYQLPLTLTGGDRLEILSAGAYTASYASAFNGFSRLRTYCL